MFAKLRNIGIAFGATLCYCLLFHVYVYIQHQPPPLPKDVDVPGWERNVSRNTRLYVLPDSDTTLINVDSPCSPELLLVIIVISAPSNFKGRSTIRDTWAAFADKSARVLFLLGESPSADSTSKIIEESKAHKDIIQERFVESYKNLTIKSVMLLKWVQRHCSQAQFVMKADDDIYVNIKALKNALQVSSVQQNLLLGSLIVHGKLIQDSTSRYYMPQYIFNKSEYPEYLSGPGYVMSRDVVTKLYVTALKTPIVYIEDVYITGICAKLAGVKLLESREFFKKGCENLCRPSTITCHLLESEIVKTYFKSCLLSVIIEG